LAVWLAVQIAAQQFGHVAQPAARVKAASIC
jgi:hypothetical protein